MLPRFATLIARAYPSPLQIYTNFATDGGPKGDQDYSLVYVPTIVLAFFVVCGLAFIYATRQF